MGPIGSGTKGTHKYSCWLYKVSICKCRSDFLNTGCQFKKAQSAKTIYIRGLRKIEVETQIREATMCKAQGSLPFCFYGYHEFSITI